MRDGAIVDSADDPNGNDSKRLQAFYERLKQLAKVRRALDEETIAVWHEVKELESRL